MAHKPKAPARTDIKKALMGMVRRKGEVSLVEATAHVAEKLGVSKKAQSAPQPCGKESRLQNAVRWARWELQREGKVKTTRRGYFAAL